MQYDKGMMKLLII